MAYGFASWDASGKPNNYGIKPISVVGQIKLAKNQNSGKWTFSIPDGFKINVVEVVTDYSYNNVQRFITVGRDSISISGSGQSNAVMAANECYLVVYMEKI